MKNKIEKKLEITLNEMQMKTFALNGKNIIIKAPTGSGKTVAALLNCKKGEKYYYFLPTVSACNFMYETLKDLNLFNVKINTSLRSEAFKVESSEIKIEILSPDNELIKFIKSGKANKNIIMDEIDSYPLKVQSAAMHFLKHNTGHSIVLSATLADELKNELQNFEFIKFKDDLEFIKHKMFPINSIKEIADTISENCLSNRSVAIILNSIKDIENIYEEIEEFLPKHIYKNIVILHSKLTNKVRRDVEKDLYDNKIKILISNDIVSNSLDINFDCLIMQLSDKMNVNIQRLGRNNRSNCKNINHRNLGIIMPFYCDMNEYLPFISEDGQIECLNKMFNITNDEHEKLDNNKFTNCLTYKTINEWRNELEVPRIFTVEELQDHIESQEDEGLEPSLRENSFNFVYNFDRVEIVYKNGKAQDNFVRDSITYKFDHIPLSRNPISCDDNTISILYIMGEEYKIIDKVGNDFIIELLDETDDFSEEIDDNYGYENPYLPCNFNFENYCA